MKNHIFILYFLIGGLVLADALLVERLMKVEEINSIQSHFIVSQMIKSFEAEQHKNERSL